MDQVIVSLIFGTLCTAVVVCIYREAKKGGL